MYERKGLIFGRSSVGERGMALNLPSTSSSAFRFGIISHYKGKCNNYCIEKQPSEKLQTAEINMISD